jgi:hypothetical protein
MVTRAPGGIVCATACALLLAGCEEPGRPHLAASRSPDGTYEVRLTGRVSRAVIFEKRVRAEIRKNGVLHLPARLIFAAGLFDTTFEQRFGPPQWAAANVLRFPSRRDADGREPDILTVRNTAPRAFPSIRVETDRDMFLVIDLGPGREVTLPTAAPARPEAPNWFDIVVDGGDPDGLLRGHGTFDNTVSPRPRFTFVVSVSAEGVEVAGTSAQPGPSGS